MLSFCIRLFGCSFAIRLSHSTFDSRLAVGKHLLIQTHCPTKSISVGLSLLLLLLLGVYPPGLLRDAAIQLLHQQAGIESGTR